MAQYGSPDVAIAGLLFGEKHDVDSAIAQENIAFGAPVFGFVGSENKVYGYHKDKGTITLAGDTVTSNVITTVIQGISVATTFATDHATTMTTHIAAVNAKAELIALGITAAPGTSNRIIVISAPAKAELVITSVITLGAGQAAITIVYGTNAKFLGVAPFIQVASKVYGAGNACWEANQAVNIVKAGEIWVLAESSVSDKDPAYAVTGGSGTVGKFTDVATSNYDLACYFRSNVTNGLARLEVRGLK